ncbi:hypothetical protein PoB_005548900 [Plakobranchus ocellatus]|uniref:Uncharacterized protein n=1 Tax=Plakobranchus ocellatus TaxID=259542 RepID=A0AAV4C8U4_9GAST|nr:hypothetical protein PoB_005548900 [Plakobranchus ocellatus]
MNSRYIGTEDRDNGSKSRDNRKGDGTYGKQQLQQQQQQGRGEGLEGEKEKERRARVELNRFSLFSQQVSLITIALSVGNPSMFFLPARLPPQDQSSVLRGP